MKDNEKQLAAVPAGGLTALDQVQLSPALDRLYQDALPACGGPPAWRSRKKTEGWQLLALSQISPRLNILELDLRESLRALAFMRVPVPLRPDEHGDLRTAPYAMLGFTYRESAVTTPSPGYQFVQILQPEGCFHANVWAQDGGQALCLGTHLPAGIRMKEIVLMTYSALAMQSIMIDEQAREGVMNREAARWWQLNMSSIPLTRDSFLSGAEGYLATSREEKD